MAGKLNTELVRRRRQEIDKQEEDRKKGLFWDKLEGGANKRRFLPPWNDEGNWRRKFGMHYNVLENDTVLCPLITFGTPCPICETNKELFKSKDPSEKDFAKKIRGKEAFVSNVLNLDKNDAKVYTLEFGQGVEADITKIIDPGETNGPDGKPSTDVFGYGDITDPKTGRTILITKTVPADKMQTSYEVKSSLNASEVANWPEIEKQIHDLDEYVRAKQVHTYDDLVAMMNGTYQPKSTPATKPEQKAAEVKKAVENVVSKPQTDEFGNPSKAAPVKEATEEFTKPTGTPALTITNPAPVELTQPGKVMSALDRLKAQKKAKEEAKV